MALGDAAPVAPDAETLLSDAEKNQDAANACDAVCKRMLNQIARCVDAMNQEIAAAPGTKAAILALSAGTEATIQAFIDPLITAHTANKAASTPTLAF